MQEAGGQGLSLVLSTLSCGSQLEGERLEEPQWGQLQGQPGTGWEQSFQRGFPPASHLLAYVIHSFIMP